ncbi:probable proteasome subunit beta type-2 [Drosophila guanche]|uniref:Blast:Probable proteasome subunit beta type-2 n=1 Tax=Drosophila guanche TaxID=7266 RepID=A0A3B0JK02_DROGU|nr:probable proteasome subunit beta type-2 [Drosophila guanche]SPP81123.1 blast:Probable proteasome subunit beta type-2 [Drosophila guanche]
MYNNLLSPRYDMDTMLAIKGKDFVLLSANIGTGKGLLMLDQDKSKIERISDYSMIAAAGEGGDPHRFVNSIAKHSELHRVQHNGLDMPVNSIAHFAGKQICANVMENLNYKVSALIAGWGPLMGPQLYQIDEFGGLRSVPYSGQGVGMALFNSIFQKYNSPDIDEPTAYKVLKQCVAAAHERLAVNMRHFEVFVVKENGITKLNTIDADSLKTAPN